MSFGQGGPGWGPGGPNTPDWNALAEDAEATRARKRRWLLLGGGALATVAVAAIVAVAVISEGNGSPSDTPSSALPTPEDLPSSPAQPEPTFNTEAPPPPPNPHDYISDPKKDTAPLSTKTLFPVKKIKVNGRTFTRTATDSTKNCASLARGKLGPILTANKCREMHRATFTRDGIAITVGIAVFDSEAAAKKARDDAEPNVAPLPGGGTPEFCRASACRASANALGRYAYFTVSGYLNGTDVTEEETKARTAGLDVAKYAFLKIRQRGEAQAQAAATDPARNG
ncbi:hypothetical protein [Streptomyces gobiensis]|uniref:hypothetical protein n=1 Tax=Streptomyces gobiensis TaxID=2875706 RepID=UPI001E64E645|nr:hypothetical protein [Streptomyces gobiensis]UGY93136.1 hypothetical protein test1122_16405 [Streptomyces gobiensis]